ncbi:MAG TPA: hypothetical protein PLK82_08470 [Bacteroidales bacterium]|mgnify:CR=1 FL=1|nr:hypothetical protein [Bacteroidales bacterium]
MNSIKTKRNFFDLFNTDYSILKVKFNVNSDETPTEVHIENSLGKKTDTNDLIELARICADERLKDFVGFYSDYDGFNLATPKAPQNAVNKTLLRQLPASDIVKFTNQYVSGGQWAWTIDLNKTKAIYRRESKWLAFAEVDGGPACLTIFLDGENAGNVFLLCPQPHFNTLKPIAKTYTDLLKRIAKDPAAFFKLTRAFVTLYGKDNQNYGYVPIEYIDNR